MTNQDKIRNNNRNNNQNYQNDEEGKKEAIEAWKPKTELGVKVKSGEINSIDEILRSGKKILEPGIVDVVLPNLESELLSIGQSKGKFGGGKKSIWKQTQKKTKEGNKPKFATLALVGNKEGYLGIGHGKSKETMPAREKAIRNAKLNMISVLRGCGSWDCGCNTNHSLPFKISGKSGSVIVTLTPAAKGTGLKAEQGIQKMLEFAGYTDAYAKSTRTQTKLNLLLATFHALKKITKFRTLK
jgi:small subunit ribosomal protein S5